MPTLDLDISLPQYRLTLRCLSSRLPTRKMAQKIGESLQLARKITNDAYQKVAWILSDANNQGYYPVAYEAVKYHFEVDAQTRDDYRNHILKVLRQTASGLSEEVTLSDVLNYYTWDDYLLPKLGRVVGCEFRAGTDKEAMEGYVKLSRAANQRAESGLTYVTGEEFVKGATSIHIEFSVAKVYPPFQLARVIVHEATHKFAGTRDEAYTQEEDYNSLSDEERIFNADSYAYVVISIAFNQLIKDYKECFRVIPQYGPPDREQAADKLLHGRGRSQSFSSFSGTGHSGKRVVRV